MSRFSFSSPSCISSSSGDGEMRAQTRRQFAWVLRVGVLCAVGLGFWHLLLLNALATKGFELSELKNNRVQIQKEMEKWDISLTIPTSLYALESSEQIQEMVDADEKIFLEIRNEEVAINQERPLDFSL